MKLFSSTYVFILFKFKLSSLCREKIRSKLMMIPNCKIPFKTEPLIRCLHTDYCDEIRAQAHAG